MVRGLGSQLFAAGPAVAAAIGDTLDREELGGVDVHTRVDDEVASEAEALRAGALVRPTCRRRSMSARRGRRAAIRRPPRRGAAFGRSARGKAGLFDAAHRGAQA